MGKHKISGLSKDENNYLLKCLTDYRTKKIENKALGTFYQEVINAHSFDALGRFTNHSETGLERVVWVIWDERKTGYAAHVEYKEGDKITLLNGQGAKIREPITLDNRSAEWAEYFEMCATLGIDPNDDFKYFIGLTKKK